MEKHEAVKSMSDYAELLRRRWRYPVLIIPAGLLAALLLAYSLPEIYASTAVIMQEPQEVPADMVRTTVAVSQDKVLDATQQLELTRRKIMSGDALLDIVKKRDPYPLETGLTPAQKASRLASDTSVERVDPITAEPAEASTAFSIVYRNPDRQMSTAVGKELVDLFLTYNRRSRAEQAEAALRFLQAQASELERTMMAQEQGLAKFKIKYGTALPEYQGRNLAGVDRAQRDIEAFEAQIRAAEERQSLLELQLTELSPSLTAAVGDWRTHMAKLRADLAAAEQKYTPQHPDVRALKRAVAELAAQGAAGTAGDGSKPDNPEYLRVQNQLASVKRELDGLRINASRARRDLASYETSLASSPNTEREYTQLQRDYDVAQARYNDVQGKIKMAALAKTLEAEERGERFTVIRSPSAAEKPVSPNRLGILLIGFVLSGAIAIGAAVFADTSDPTVRGISDLESIMSVSPVGAVPLIFNRQDHRRRRLRWGAIAAAYLLATLLVATVAYMS
jgi:polysaccharide chain length determinant protein (PEP-CTERM system associated)